MYTYIYIYIYTILCAEPIGFPWEVRVAANLGEVADTISSVRAQNMTQSATSDRCLKEGAQREMTDQRASQKGEKRCQLCKRM